MINAAYFLDIFTFSAQMYIKTNKGSYRIEIVSIYKENGIVTSLQSVRIQTECAMVSTQTFEIQPNEIQYIRVYLSSLDPSTTIVFSIKDGHYSFTNKSSDTSSKLFFEILDCNHASDECPDLKEFDRSVLKECVIDNVQFDCIPIYNSTTDTNNCHVSTQKKNLVVKSQNFISVIKLGRLKKYCDDVDNMMVSARTWNHIIRFVKNKNIQMSFLTSGMLEIKTIGLKENILFYIAPII